jgi:HSP20 family protein
LEVLDGTLSVSYQQQTEKKADEGMLLRREFSMESFKRSFQLDETIDADNISAKYENGILTLWLPKKPEMKPSSRQINIV